MIDQKSSHIIADGLSCTIARTSSYTGPMIVAKLKGSNSDYTFGNRRLINALLASSLTTGEIITAGDETLICVASKKEIIRSTDVSIIAHGLVCNATLTATRGVPTYDSNGNVTGSSTTTVITSANCRVDAVTARMRQEEPGLLATTVLKVYAKDVVGLLMLDKAAISGRYYRVDDIDRFQIPGAMVLQLGTWNGG